MIKKEGAPRKAKPARVTQRDVAEFLGISQALVARALNGDPVISAATRTRIFEGAKTLGYSRASYADPLESGAKGQRDTLRHGTIGCMGLSPVRSCFFPFKAHQFEGIMERSGAAGMEVLQLGASFPQGLEKVDGVIIDGCTLAEYNSCLDLSIPIVTMMSVFAGQSGVLADDFQGALLAARHLVSLGHRRIGYLLDLEELSPLLERRLEGYRTALRESGIEPQSQWLAPLCNTGHYLERGRESMRAWLQGDWDRVGCTAILVQNDRAAIGAMAALRESGIRVPEQVSVVGFDGTDEGELCLPRLTSIVIPLREIGRKSVELLLPKIEGQTNLAQVLTLPVSLEVRDSTAPPPGT